MNQSLKEKLKPIFEELVFKLIQSKPDNPAEYMLHYLLKKEGYTTTGITVEEKKELEHLRKEISKYRQLQLDNKKEDDQDENEHDKSITDDENEDDEKEADSLIEKQMAMAKARMSRQREGVSAEAYGEFNKKSHFQPRVIEKTKEQVERIKIRVLQSFLFNSLEGKDVDIVINAMEEKRFSSGETVIEQGDKGDVLYIVEVGELDCFKKFSKDEERKYLKTYQSGEAFGELALLYNAPRAATVVTKTDVILWSLDRETFNNIVKEAAQKKRNQYEEFLSKVEILSTVEKYELSQIADALKTGIYAPSDYIIKEGEVGDVFYIVVDGEAVATKTLEPGKPPVEVMSYSVGEYFGELALLKGEPRAANVIAKSKLKVVSLDRHSFKRLLGPIEEILKRNSDKYMKYIK